MPKRKLKDVSTSSQPQKEMSKRRPLVIEKNYRDEVVENIYIPNSIDSGESGTDSDAHSEEISDYSESDSELDMTVPSQSYEKVRASYDNSQKKLETDHVYEWIEGEHQYADDLSNEILLMEFQKKQILACSHTEIFEFFMSAEMKKYIIEATTINDYALTLEKFDTFLGVIIFTIINKRLSQRDYWSGDPLLRSDIITKSMGRVEFEKIKTHLKLSKPTDANNSDKVWRVRHVLNIFNENIKKFGFFSTALSIDEMMIKYFGHNRLKQFIKSKPIRFGIKMWALCGANGYLFHCNIYCGKNNDDSTTLSNCAQGSRVVMEMLQQFLLVTTGRKLGLYHVYFDNLFCSPDLVLHLKKIGIKSTGTVRKDRIKESNEIDKKSPKGTYKVKHDKNSGINFLTVQDSKPVSILTTAASATPLSSVRRFTKESRQKTEIPFPNAFTSYNKFMGGVDLHDQHCNKVMPIVRSKKWTWTILMRIIQASIANATVLYNSASSSKNKLGTKDFALSISKAYLAKQHKIETKENRVKCSKCKIRTNKICVVCENRICKNCIQNANMCNGK